MAFLLFKKYVLIGVWLLHNVVLVSGCSKASQLYICRHPLFFGFPPRLGPHRAPRRVPCAVAQVLVSYLFYTRYCAPFLCQILGGSGYLREACCPGGFRREGPLRFFFFKLKCNIHQGKCVSAKDTTQSVFAQLHTQVTISQMKIRIISKPLKVPPELSQITPPPTGAVLILSPCMALPGLNFIKMIIMLIYSSCSSFFLKNLLL